MKFQVTFEKLACKTKTKFEDQFLSKRRINVDQGKAFIGRLKDFFKALDGLQCKLIITKTWWFLVSILAFMNSL